VLKASGPEQQTGSREVVPGKRRQFVESGTAGVGQLLPVDDLRPPSLLFILLSLIVSRLQLGNALHDPSYYDYAFNFLRYALTQSSGLISHGVLQERCEAFPGQCAHLGFHLDLPAYKGIFVDAVSDWSKATRSKAFRPFLQAQAVAVVDNTIRAAGDAPGRCATPQSCQFAFSWTGRPQPPSLGVTLGGQESAIDALTAVLPQRG